MRVRDTGDLEIDLSEGNAAWADAEGHAKRARHAKQCHQRGADQQGAYDDLDEEQHVSHGEAAEGADDTVQIYGILNPKC